MHLLYYIQIYIVPKKQTVLYWFFQNFNQLVLRNEYNMFILVVVNSCQIIGFFFYNDAYYVCKKFDFTT